MSESSHSSSFCANQGNNLIIIVDQLCIVRIACVEELSDAHHLFFNRWGLIGVAGACLAGGPVNMFRMKACCLNAAVSSIAPVSVFILFMLGNDRPFLGFIHDLLSWLERFAAGAAFTASADLLMPIGRQQHPALALRFGLLGGLGTLLLSAATTWSYAVTSAVRDVSDLQ